MTRVRSLAVALICVMSLYPAAAADVSLEGRRAVPEAASAPPAAASGLKSPLSPLLILGAAGAEAPRELAALEAANASRIGPWQIGFERNIGGTAEITERSFWSQTAADGTAILTGSYTVAGAWLTRARLARVILPPGTQIWTYGEDGVAQGPVGAAQLSPGGDLWLPSVAGEKVWIEVRVPAGEPLHRGLSMETPGPRRTGPLRFVLDGVSEQFRLDAAGRPMAGVEAGNYLEPCLVDISCVAPATDIDNASAAVGSYTFVHKKKTFVCTGGLLNDAGGSGQEYFLTANHCLSKSKDVRTMETWWDYRSSVCDGTVNISLVPKSFGASLLAQSSLSDFTFVRIEGVPSNRYFFGWTTGAPVGTIGRVSNPGGGLQTYSETTDNNASGGSCNGLPPSEFLYQDQTFGAIAGGASGAPSFVAGGFVVGQLFGLCGQHPGDDCDLSNFVVDGRFSDTFPTISPWLTDPTGTPTAVADLGAIKLSSKKATISWTDTSLIEDRFDIVEISGGIPAVIGSLDGNTTSAKIKGLQGGQQYEFGVQACLGSLCSTIESIILLTP